MTSSHPPTRQDLALLRRILLKLTASFKILVVVLILGVAILWSLIFQRLLDFGRGLDLDAAPLVGADANALIRHYNPYFWWVVAILCTLIVIRVTWSAARALLAQARQKPVDATSFARLADQLSAPALDVLLWTWPEHDEPLRVGDLLRTRDELSQGRANRLQQASDQRRILNAARDQRAPLAGTALEGQSARDAKGPAATRSSAP